MVVENERAKLLTELRWPYRNRCRKGDELKDDVTREKRFLCGEELKKNLRVKLMLSMKKCI